MKTLIFVLVLLLSPPVYGRSTDNDKKYIMYNDYPVLPGYIEAEVNNTLFYYIIEQPMPLRWSAIEDIEHRLNYLSDRIYFLEMKNKFSYKFDPSLFFPLPTEKKQ